MLSVAEAINFIHQNGASIEPLGNCYKTVKKLLEDNLYVAERSNGELVGLALYYKINEEDIENLPSVYLNWQMLPNRPDGEIAYIDTLIIKNKHKGVLRKMWNIGVGREKKVKFLLWYDLKNSKWHMSRRRKL